MTQLIFRIAFVLTISSGAHGFSLNSTSNPDFKGWAGGKVFFSLNSGSCPANVPTVIAEAIEIWRDVGPTNIEIFLVGETTLTTANNPVTIYCETNFGAAIGGGAAENDNVPGVAIIGPGGAEFATQGRLILNTSTGNANVANLDQTVLTIVMAHEIGHILGLGHSHDTSALMYFDASAKNQLSLAQDDIDGIAYLYPRRELDGDGILGGCGTIKPPGPPDGGRLLMLALLMALPLAFTQGLRQRASS